jgi:hypothetical protein
MNQTEWLSCTDPKLMIGTFFNHMSDYQLKKFSVACYYEINSLLTDEAKAAVKAFEADIDGNIAPEVLSSAKGLLESEVFDSSSSGTIGGIVSDYVLMLFSSSALETTQDALDAVERVIPWTFDSAQHQTVVFEAKCAEARQIYMARLANQLREIVGNPFQEPVQFATRQ